jgi:hypothetical protein
MGIAVIGGLITSTLLTLLVVPVVYTLMDALSRRAIGLWALVTRRRSPSPVATEPRPATVGSADEV